MRGGSDEAGGSGAGATAATAGWCGRGPGAEGFLGEGVLLALGSQVGVVGVGGALAEAGVYVCVPLADPGHYLGQACQEGLEAVNVPAVGGGTFLDERGQGVGLFAVVPAGPAEQQGVIAVGAGAWVGDKALLGDVEFAALAPVGVLAEVGVLVLRGDGDIQALSGAVLGDRKSTRLNSSH